jgi:hydroxypyruvate isomerase
LSDPVSRRNFLATGALAAVATVAATRRAVAQDATSTTAAATPATSSAANPRGGAFKLLYAPHFGLFEKLAGKDPIDQLKFMADQGFRALEDNQMPKKPVDLQSKIGETMASLNMEMGIFVAHGDFGAQSFVKRDPAIRDLLVKDMQAAVEVAKRINAKWCTVVLDAVDPKMDPGIQMANVIDNLRACAEVLEKANLIAVLEPLNRWNHPNLYLTTVPQAYAICRAVDSPSIKILYDIYHAQIQAGNLIPNIDYCWDEIPYYQVGDNPGRNEPGTGEINYHNIFKHLHEKGYKGIIGMEHGKANNSPEGERAVIQAYHEADNF